MPDTPGTHVWAASGFLASLAFLSSACFPPRVVCVQATSLPTHTPGGHRDTRPLSAAMLWYSPGCAPVAQLPLSTHGRHTGCHDQALAMRSEHRTRACSGPPVQSPVLPRHLAKFKYPGRTLCGPHGKSVPPSSLLNVALTLPWPRLCLHSATSAEEEALSKPQSCSRAVAEPSKGLRTHTSDVAAQNTRPAAFTAVRLIPRG